MHMKTDELREKYLEFFQGKGHKRCASDVLVPTWDPSVLFTPAGMNQFKDHFLGKVQLEFTRATTCQKCLRTGDIENVGRTAYHHTFFEMLGNFSFGDYFKREAIAWAWEFLTEKRWLGLDPSRLTVSVYLDDDEAAEIWARDIGLSTDRIQRMDEYENFWPARRPTDGPDGVCGPCSEIFFHPDHGNEVEIWNLVFTQFNRKGDPPDNLVPLPSNNIDTGMGLERTAATLQGVATNFHIDTLRPIVEAAAEVCGVTYEFDSDNGRRLRRITDHMRACTMSVHENVYPGSQKEKYVIRRLLRRAVLDGHQMGMREPFLYQLVPAVVEQMKAPYPELTETVARVAEVIKNEESNFLGTIDAGLVRIQRIFDQMESANQTMVNGAEAADLYQTFGVPPEMFESMATERKLGFDWDGFRAAMEEHGEASGKPTHVVMGTSGPIDEVKQKMTDCEFVGYARPSIDATVKFVVANGEIQATWNRAGEQHPAIVVLDRTPFYGESGGQVGDTGILSADRFQFRVTDTQKDSNLILHQGYLESGEIQPGDTATASVASQRREGIKRAHSATHILHHALQKNLGTHAQQQGSKVDDDWLRFDFTNMSPVTDGQMSQVQAEVDRRVAEAAEIRWDVLPLPDARAAGAMMLFGEKYPDPVRMVSMGEFSKELCGGTHLTNTSQVGQFEIIAEEGVSAGTRRIIALTGDRAANHAAKTLSELRAAADWLGVRPLDVAVACQDLLQKIRDLKKHLSTGTGTSGGHSASKASLADGGPADGRPADGGAIAYAHAKSVLRQTARDLNVPLFEVTARLRSLTEEVKTLEQNVAKLSAAGEISAEALMAGAEQIDGTAVVVSEIPGGNPNLLRQLIDGIRQKSDSSAVMLAAGQGDSKVVLVAGVSHDLIARGASAGNWVREVAPIVGGGGGGKADMAQAGGKCPEKLAEALEKARDVIRAMINA